MLRKALVLQTYCCKQLSGEKTGVLQQSILCVVVHCKQNSTFVESGIFSGVKNADIKTLKI